MHSLQPQLSPQPDLLVDAANGRSLLEVDRVAQMYRAEGYDVYYALNPLTGSVALYRKAVAARPLALIVGVRQ